MESLVTRLKLPSSSSQPLTVVFGRFLCASIATERNERVGRMVGWEGEVEDKGEVNKGRVEYIISQLLVLV